MWEDDTTKNDTGILGLTLLAFLLASPFEVPLETQLDVLWIIICLFVEVNMIEANDIFERRYTKKEMITWTLTKTITHVVGFNVGSLVGNSVGASLLPWIEEQVIECWEWGFKSKLIHNMLSKIALTWLG